MTRYRPIGFSVVALAALLGACGFAKAQAPCAAYNDIVVSLAQKHGELPVFQGASTNGYVLQVFASEAGSYSVLAVKDQIGCFMDAGENAAVKALPPPAPKEGKS